MKIEFAQPAGKIQLVKSGGKTLQIQKATRGGPGIRKGNNAIRKNKNGLKGKKAGKTLSLIDSKKGRNPKRRRANSGAGDTGAGGNKKGKRFNSRKFN